MLSHSFSPSPAIELLSRKDVLAVIPLVKNCEPFEAGLIPAGIEEANAQEINEVWTVTEEVSRGKTGECNWSKTSELMCLAIWLSKNDCTTIEAATKNAYAAMLSVLMEAGYPHPFRFWNYLPGINAGQGDEELYKKFCTGRLQAFEHLGYTPDTFPSASALGHHTEGAVFYVFASATKPVHFNNQNQVNAYEYPRQYGISSPSFARATALTLQQSPYLFISGTASIIGHKTVEAGNLERQLHVTMTNIEHLLEHANPDNRTLSTFKVYVRHPHHVQRTKDWLEQRYPGVDAVYTLADICRSDLLVEIECFCR
ncbi:dioxygenase [Alteromonas ponticola]|uniref:Dioxygenase n=1 Tax=Alteromonas ponticola TaxID=2720613 RepID=A0ABX1R5Z7_9ALTE|nr:dioxygenase [Alteromonas ponticola]NMH60670.1 dioxygenase [Alteromonas ponticola]